MTSVLMKIKNWNYGSKGMEDNVNVKENTRIIKALRISKWSKRIKIMYQDNVSICHEHDFSELEHFQLEDYVGIFQNIMIK